MKIFILFAILGMMLFSACTEQDIAPFGERHEVYFYKYFMDEEMPIRLCYVGNAFINNCRTKKIRGNLYVLSEPEYHFLLRDDSFIFVDNGHDAKEIREALKTLPKAHYVVFMLYRSQISGNSRKDRSVTEYDKKPYLL